MPGSRHTFESRTGGSRLGWLPWIIAVVALLLLALSRMSFPRLDEERVRTAVTTTLERETPSSFLVAGSADVVATTEVENTRLLFPNLLNLSLGTSRSTVRAPGKVWYGFDVRDLMPDMIAVGDDGSVTVRLPELSVLSVEADLSQMEVETELGWARHTASGEAVEQEAMAGVNEAFRAQGTAHLQDSAQPRINGAHALQKALGPLLESLGVPRDRFRIDLGDGMILTLERDRPIV